MSSAGKYVERWESQFVFYTPVLAIILLIFPPNTLSPTQAHWARQANRLSAGRQAFTLGLGMYRDYGPLPKRVEQMPTEQQASAKQALIDPPKSGQRQNIIMDNT